MAETWLAAKIARNSIRADWRSRLFVSSTNSLAACRKTVLLSPTWASTRCGRRSVIVRIRRADLSLPADLARWALLCRPPSAFSYRSRDATVLCVSGDGGFQMNIQELATVRRLNLPIKMVIVDNKYLGMVRQWQQLFYQRNYAETDLSDNPDFVEIAKAYRINAERLYEDADARISGEQETGDASGTFSEFVRAGIAGV